jgi:hypothetical protein
LGGGGGGRPSFSLEPNLKTFKLENREERLGVCGDVALLLPLAMVSLMSSGLRTLHWVCRGQS